MYIYLSIYLSIRPSIYLSIYLSIRPSIYLSIYKSLICATETRPPSVSYQISSVGDSRRILDVPGISKPFPSLINRGWGNHPGRKLQTSSDHPFGNGNHTTYWWWWLGDGANGTVLPSELLSFTRNHGWLLQNPRDSPPPLIENSFSPVSLRFFSRISFAGE